MQPCLHFDVSETTDQAYTFDGGLCMCYNDKSNFKLTLWLILQNCEQPAKAMFGGKKNKNNRRQNYGT